MPTTDESGLRRTANYWVPEVEEPDGAPVTPADPNWNLYSRTAKSEGGESSAEWQESLGLGEDVSTDKHRSVESHERTIAYEMYRFPVDALGAPQDPFYYASKRDIDNQFEATLSHLKVVEQASLVENNTVHHKYFTELDDGENTHPGVDPGAPSGLASRTETYARGGFPDEPELVSNPSDEAIITLEIPYQFAKVRKHQIDQPSDSYIHVRSTDPGDTAVDVQIESVDGTTSETVPTDGADGTVAAGSAETYSSLRVWVGGEFNGTIEVYADDGSGAGAPGAPAELLTYIRGAGTYDGIESDSGVPMVGAGSYETVDALPEDGVSALKSAGEWDGHPAAQRIMGSTVTVANNLDPKEPAGTLAQDIKVGQREPEAESSVYGETESTDKFGDHIEGREGRFVIPTPRGDIIFPRAYCNDGGSPEQEEGEAVLEVDVTFRALAPRDGSDAIEFEHADAA